MGREYEETEVVERRSTSRTAWLLVVLLLLAGGAAIYWLRAQLEIQAARAAAAERTVVLKERTIQEAAKARSGAESKVGELQSEITELMVANEQLATDVKAKAEELERIKATTTQIEEKLKQEISRGEIRLTSVGGRLQVELVDKILFDSGEALVSKRGENVLMRVGQVLAEVKDKQIQVSGHTDNAPISEKLAAQFPTNWELSVARATNVVRFLAEKGGVPEGILAIAGHGPHRPVASNATPQGRARNRRIEILLTPMIEPVHGRNKAIAKK
jgi:chemotaxis protein MotB